MQDTSCFGVDGFNQCLSGTKSPTLMCQRSDYKNVPSVLIKKTIDCYSIDEKMGQTYIHHDIANTLAQRDYKQPQAVIVHDY